MLRQVARTRPAPSIIGNCPPVPKYPFSSSANIQNASLEDPPKGNDPRTPGRQPPSPPPQETEHLQKDSSAASFLGTTKRLPEFNLTDKVIVVSGAARGLGLTQAEALLEAGATVYALDCLPEPSPDYYRVQKRAAEDLGTTLYYRQIDVRDVEGLNKVVADIGDKHGRLDGLLAAAGIQQETPALEYTAEDVNKMLEVNVTGVFMTSQAVAKQMIKFGSGGSICLIASMSASVANRVSAPTRSVYHPFYADLTRASYVLPTMLQRLASFNLPVIWPLNGANMVSVSILSRQVI